MSGSEQNNKVKLASSFIKYAGLGFQMLAVIGVFAFVGYKVDEKRKSDQPIFTAILGLIGVVVALYQVIRSLTKHKS